MARAEGGPAGSSARIQLIDSMVNALRASREYVYDIANICRRCEHKARVFKWVRAEEGDIREISNEIEKGYKLALKKCLGSRLAEHVERGIASIFSVIRSFESTLLPQRWLVYTSRSLGAALIRDLESGKLYYVNGWDSSRPVSSSMVMRKLLLKSVRGKQINYKVLIARRFSKSAKEFVKKFPDSVLIDLGFLGEEERAEITLHGNLDAKDPLMSSLVPFLKSSLGPDGFRIEGTTGFPKIQVPRFVASGAVRTFKEYYRVTDCGHLHIAIKKPRPAFYIRREAPFEGLLERAGSQPWPEPEEGAEEVLSELKRTYEELLATIERLCGSELVTAVVKKDVDGNLCKSEVRFLCKACENSFIDRVEMHYPCRGDDCLFEHFLTKLGEKLGCSSRYVDAYGLGVLEGRDGNIIVSRGRLSQPRENVSIFNPKWIVCIVNFFSNKLESGVSLRWSASLPSRPAVTREETELEGVALGCAAEFVTSTLAYDCDTGRYAYVPIGTAERSVAKIVERLASIDYTVEPRERAYKAPHDRIVEICRNMGLEFGLRPVTEYRINSDRIDVAWLNKDTEALEVAIEVELSASIVSDLWKLCEAHPNLAVLIVKGGSYDSALGHVSRSEIIKKIGLRLMILDISSKAYLLVEGGRILGTCEGANPQ